MLATVWRDGDSDDLRRAAWRTARTHPVDLVGHPELLDQLIQQGDQADAKALALLTRQVAEHEPPSNAKTAA